MFVEECILLFDRASLDPDVQEFLDSTFGEKFINEFRCVCSSPSGPCSCSYPEIERIEGYEREDYWNRHDRKDHVLVSDRWHMGCGIHTRVYLRKDGCIVFSHDTAGFSGVHVVIPIGKFRERIREFVNRCSTLIDIDLARLFRRGI